MSRLALCLVLAPALAAAADGPTRRAPAAAPDEAVQDVLFLGEGRPIFLRLRIDFGGKALRSAWMDSVRSLHGFLDRDGDGKVTAGEADKGALGTIVRLATAGASALPRTELDNHPKDGMVSVEELADALRTALGPFRVQVGRQVSGRTDALFGQIDRDSDGVLSRQEMEGVEGSLGRLDLDDDELIGREELEPFSNPLAAQEEDMPGRRGRLAPPPPVLELTAGDTSMKPVRVLLQRYDTGRGGAKAGDHKLARSEFALDAAAFGKADRDGNGAMDVEELRRFLAGAEPEVEVKVGLSADASGEATVEVAVNLPEGMRVQPLGPNQVEIAIDEVHLEVFVDDGAGAVKNAKNAFMAAFQAADSNNDGYLERSEVQKDDGHASPLAGLFDLLDRDGNGKLYPDEVDDFVERQSEAAKNRTVLTASDQGRAFFGILDTDRDRRLGLRELRSTIARIASCDIDGDGKITADEIPHRFDLTIGRGGLPGMRGLGAGAVAVADRGMPAPDQPAAGKGPNWFHRMDRNRDGDVSRREFLGSRDQFAALDRDGDGLIDAGEAEAATGTVAAKASAGK